MLARKSESAAPSVAKAFSKNVSNGLRVGDANSVHEQEADRVADEVMAGETPRIDWSLSKMSIGSGLQRQCACGGSSECAECAGNKTVQRKADGTGGGTYAPAIVHEVLSSPGRPLDPATRAFFEPRFGHDLSKVRIHTDAHASQSARAVSALAYAIGSDVVMGSEQYSPGTREGKQILAHELAHVIQQSADPAQTGPNLGIAEAGSAFESEAGQTADTLMDSDRGAGIVITPSGRVLRRFGHDVKTCREADLKSQISPGDHLARAMLEKTIQAAVYARNLPTMQQLSGVFS